MSAFVSSREPHEYADLGPSTLPRVCICGAGTGFVPPGVTYVVQRERWVKVGTTSSLNSLINQRIPALSRRGAVRCPAEMDQSAPLRQCLVLPYNREHEIHWVYREHHAAGEWFHLDGPMLAGLGAWAARP